MSDDIERHEVDKEYTMMYDLKWWRNKNNYDDKDRLFDIIEKVKTGKLVPQLTEKILM